jgi:hypothetical protein
MIDNNIMPTSGSREIDPITLAKIKQKSQEREYEVVDDPIGRIKLKNYTHEDSALTYEKPLNLYYCSLCGAHLLVTTSPLTGLVRRRSDQAIILSESQDIQFQRYFKPGDTVGIRRKNGIEVQYRWNCKECNIPIAYQNLPHNTFFPNEIASSSSLVSESPVSKRKIEGTAYLYIIRNSLAADMSYSELVESISRIR